jgi:hypothetical protein
MSHIHWVALGVLNCLLLIDKGRSKNKTYMIVGVMKD